MHPKSVISLWVVAGLALTVEGSGPIRNNNNYIASPKATVTGQPGSGNMIDEIKRREVESRVRRIATTTPKIQARQDDDNGGGLPTLSDGGSSGGGSSKGGLPTLTPDSSSSASTSTLPVPQVTVPPMGNNPYLATSKLPEGTVFIAVGAILGGFALALMLWRLFSTLSLRRSLKRSDSSGPLMSAVDDRNMFYPGDPTRAGDHQDSTALASHGAPPAGNPAAAHSLFFSPTAEVMSSANGGGSTNNTGSFSSMYGGVGIGGAGAGTGGTLSSMGGASGGARNSVYLPAGYYTPGGNGGAASITSRTTRNFSMARDSMYGGGGGGTPSVRTSTMGNPPQAPHSQPQQRAPSAYLDDLLGHDNA